MASSGKKKTTMAKLNRERKLRERRLDKQARKAARQEAARNPGLDDVVSDDDVVSNEEDQSGETGHEQPASAPPTDP